jgi:hypothetical protein
MLRERCSRVVRRLGHAWVGRAFDRWLELWCVPCVRACVRLTRQLNCLAGCRGPYSWAIWWVGARKWG